MLGNGFLGNISPPFTCADAMIVDANSRSHAAGGRLAGLTTTAAAATT